MVKETGRGMRALGNAKNIPTMTVTNRLTPKSGRNCRPKLVTRNTLSSAYEEAWPVPNTLHPNPPPSHPAPRPLALSRPLPADDVQFPQSLQLIEDTNVDTRYQIAFQPPAD